LTGASALTLGGGGGGAGSGSAAAMPGTLTMAAPATPIKILFSTVTP
jgi:hypothetical protein